MFAFNFYLCLCVFPDAKIGSADKDTCSALRGMFCS